MTEPTTKPRIAVFSGPTATIAHHGLDPVAHDPCSLPTSGRRVEPGTSYIVDLTDPGGGIAAVLSSASARRIMLVQSCERPV